EDFCTVMACPAPRSVVAYWVNAVWGDQVSGPSNIATCWFKPGDPGCTCHDPAEAVPPAPPPPPPVATVPPPLTLSVLTTTPPPLPQQTAEGLHLLPVGALPYVPSAPPIPATGGVR